MHNTVLISENVLNIFENKFDARTKNSVTVTHYALSFKCLSLQQSNRFSQLNFLSREPCQDVKVAAKASGLIRQVYLQKYIHAGSNCQFQLCSHVTSVTCAQPCFYC
jgi:hypothetical protein